VKAALGRALRVIGGQGGFLESLDDLAGAGEKDVKQGPRQCGYGCLESINTKTMRHGSLP
jgi:hypothetical protein